MAEGQKVDFGEEFVGPGTNSVGTASETVSTMRFVVLQTFGKG